MNTHYINLQLALLRKHQENQQRTISIFKSTNKQMLKLIENIENAQEEEIQAPKEKGKSKIYLLEK